MVVRSGKKRRNVDNFCIIPILLLHHYSYIFSEGEKHYNGEEKGESCPINNLLLFT